MIPINRTFAPIQALVDELARCGLAAAVTCPGSRNAPLALTLAAHPAIETARARGLEWYLSSTLDGPWGIAAALQLAAAEGVRLHCGLATLELFEAEIGRALPAPQNGRMSVPQGPGLGLDVADEAINEVLVQEL